MSRPSTPAERRLASSLSLDGSSARRMSSAELAAQIADRQRRLSELSERRQQRQSMRRLSVHSAASSAPQGVEEAPAAPQAPEPLAVRHSQPPPGVETPRSLSRAGSAVSSRRPAAPLREAPTPPAAPPPPPPHPDTPERESSAGEAGEQEGLVRLLAGATAELRVVRDHADAQESALRESITSLGTAAAAERRLLHQLYAERGALEREQLEAAALMLQQLAAVRGEAATAAARRVGAAESAEAAAGLEQGRLLLQECAERAVAEREEQRASVALFSTAAAAAAASAATAGEVAEAAASARVARLAALQRATERDCGAELEQLRGELGAVRGDLREATAALVEAREREADAEAAEGAARKRAEELSSQLSAAEEAAGREAGRLRAEIQRARAAADALRGDTEQASAEGEQLRKQLTEARRQAAEQGAARSALEAQLGNEREDRVRCMQLLREQVRKQEGEREELLQRLPLMEQEMQQLRERARAAEADRARSEADAAELRQDREDAEARVGEVRAQFREKQKSDELEILRLLRADRAWREERAELERELERLGSELTRRTRDALAAQRRSVALQKKTDKAARRAAEAEEECRRMAVRVGALSRDGAAARALAESELSAVRGAHSAAQGRLDEAARRVHADWDRRVARTERDLATAERRLREVDTENAALRHRLRELQHLHRYARSLTPPAATTRALGGRQSAAAELQALSGSAPAGPPLSSMSQPSLHGASAPPVPAQQAAEAFDFDSALAGPCPGDVQRSASGEAAPGACSRPTSSAAPSTPPAAPCKQQQPDSTSRCALAWDRAPAGDPGARAAIPAP